MQRRNHTPLPCQKIKSPSTVSSVGQQRGGVDGRGEAIEAIGHLADVAKRESRPADRDMPEEGRYASGPV